MSKTKRNILTRNYSGKIAKQFVLRTWGDTSVLAGIPKARDVDQNPSAIQAQNRKRFKLAVIYATKAMTNLVLKEEYAARRRGNQSAFNVAFQDAYTGPEVSDIRTDGYTGAVGQPIRLQAIDNFRVTTVKQSLLASDQSLLEEGEALMDDNGFDWVYTTKTVNPSLPGTIVRVVAEDVPKNRVLVEQVL